MVDFGNLRASQQSALRADSVRVETPPKDSAERPLGPHRAMRGVENALFSSATTS